MTDYIIVGQGLAGTLLSFFLMKKEKTVAFVDNSHVGASSAIAAGIMNPITGRNFVKSWKTNELWPFAFKTYEELEKLLGVKIFYFKNVAMLFRNAETTNNWLARYSEPLLQNYIAPEFDLNLYQQYFGDTVCGGVEFCHSGRCDLPYLIKTWKSYLLSKQVDYLEEKFEYDLLEINKNSVKYKEFEASKIVFCEGAAAVDNPYFGNLHYNPAKGEILLVKIPDYPFKDKLVKDGIYIVPIKEDLYWVGSSYNREFKDFNPSEEEYQNLLKELGDMLALPFEVIKHQAAIRPTVRDRKPYLGSHFELENVLIFNGLGAKGSSIGPYFAAHFADWLEGKCELDKEVDINRLKKKIYQ